VQRNRWIKTIPPEALLMEVGYYEQEV